VPGARSAAARRAMRRCRGPWVPGVGGDGKADFVGGTPQSLLETPSGAAVSGRRSTGRTREGDPQVNGVDCVTPGLPPGAVRLQVY
jgi:hypothetical protein